MSDWKIDRARYGNHAAWLLQPSLWAVSVYRLGRYSLDCPATIKPLVHGLYFICYSAVRILTGIDLPRTVEVGAGLMIHHFGGVIINPQARIGERCTLRHGVTIGNRRDDDDVPTIGDDVNIGAYAQILGAVKIGDGASIGAMAVVLQDVPPGATAVGNPARVL